MFENKKRLYIFGSAALSILVILVIYFSLIASGALNLIQNNLVISSGSSEKYYDGTILTNNSWKIESGKVKDRENISITFTGSQTEIGTAENTFFIIITDENDNDVTTKYNITYIYGSLKVKVLPLKIATASHSKFYDGEVLRKDEYLLLSGELMEGHTMTVNVIGEITNVGTVLNDFIIVVIDGKNLDVTNLYEVEKVCGTLEIHPRALTIITAGDTKQYDGDPLTKDAYTFNEDTLLYGHNISVVVTGSQTEVGSSVNSVVYVITDSNGLDVTNQYEMNESLGTLKVDRRSIIISTGSDEKIYDTTELTCDEYSYEGLHENHRIEVVPIGTITNYSSISIPNAFVYSIYDADGNNISTYYDVTRDEGTLKIIPYTLIVYSDDYEVVYDGEEHFAKEYTFSEETPLFEGHFEIPREIKGYITPGSRQNVILFKFFDSNDSDKEITNNYTIENRLGQVRIVEAPLTIISSTVNKIYDGLPLLNGDHEYDIEGLLDGHEPVFENDSEITNYGSEKNIYSVKIIDKNNNDADVSIFYKFDLYFGDLNILKRDLIISTPNINITYSGKEVSLDDLYKGGENSISEDGLLPGYSIVNVKFIGTITNFGQILNSCTLEVYDGAGILSNNYNVVPNFGFLRIEKQVITIKTGDAAFEYDAGKFYKEETFNVIDGTIHNQFDGVIIDARNFIEVAEVGCYYNTAIIKLIDSTGESSLNYALTVQYGNITIYDDNAYPVNLTPKSLTLTSSTNKLFDHSEYFDTNNNLTGFEYWSILGYTYIAEVGTINDVYLNGTGTYSLVIKSLTIFDSSGRDVTTTFRVQDSYGELVIKSYSLTIKSESVMQQYNGQELTPGDLMGYIDESIDGYDIYIYLTGSRIDVGTTKMTYTLVVHDNFGYDVTESFLENYTIVNELGSLIVTKALINVTIDDVQTNVGADLSIMELEFVSNLHVGNNFEGYELKVVNKTTGILDENEIVQIRFECVITLDGVDVSSNFTFITNSPVATA